MSKVPFGAGCQWFCLMWWQLLVLTRSHPCSLSSNKTLVSLRNLKKIWGAGGEGHPPEMQFFLLWSRFVDRQGERGMGAAWSSISTCSCQMQACDMQIATRWPRLSVGFIHMCMHRKGLGMPCACTFLTVLGWWLYLEAMGWRGMHGGLWASTTLGAPSAWLTGIGAFVMHVTDT